MAIRKDLDLIAGDAWATTVRYLLPPDDLGVRAPGIPAGWIAKVQFRSHPNQATPLLELLPVVDHLLGEFPVSLTTAQTRALPALGSWGVGIESPSGDEALTLVYGRVNIAADPVS